MPEPKHILIVDDEEEIRDILCTALEIAGYRVSQTDSAAAAKRLVAEAAPDLIVTDLQLENSDGLAMIADIKFDHPQMPALLLTGVLFDEKATEELIRKKVSSYLPKTTPLRGIVAEVTRLLGA